MGLEVDYKLVKDQSKVWDGSDRHSTNAVATVVSYETIAVGMPVLDENTIDEFYRRSVMLAVARGGGPWVRRADCPVEDTYLRYEQLRCLIGLHSNAKELSVGEFNDKCLKQARESGWVTISMEDLLEEAQRALIRVNRE